MSFYNVTDNTFTISSAHEELISELFKSTIFYSFWIGASILIFFTFLLLSTKVQRRTCLFYLLSATFVMLLVTAISALVKENQERRDIFAKSLNRPQAERRILQRSAALLLMERITCFMADMALVCKLRSFYPVPAYSQRQQWLYVGPLLILIPPRLIFIGLLPAAHMLQRQALALRINITEYSLQMLWCTFATAILLYKSWRFFQRAALRGDERLKRKLRILMESILCTFLIPICFQITCVILLAINRSTMNGLFPMANACNLFTSVHLALLSTTWSAIRDRSDKDSDEYIAAPTLITSFFASQSTASALE